MRILRGFQQAPLEIATAFPKDASGHTIGIRNMTRDPNVNEGCRCRQSASSSIKTRPPAPAPPEVSIVIPTYGRKQFLAEAVDSVMQQTFSNWKLYIVDDASPTPVKEKEFDDRRIKVLRHVYNKGPAAARNTGAHAAAGNWLAFLDDDDLWDPRRLECALEWSASTDAEIRVVWTRPLDAVTGQAFGGRQLEGNCNEKILTATTPHLGATLIQRDAFIPFNESYRACEDLEWWIRATKGTSVTTVPVPLHIWRRHNSPRNRTDNAERIQQSWRLLTEYREYFDRYPAARAFRLFRLGVMLQRTDEYGQAVPVYWRVASGPHVTAHLRASAFKRLVEVLPRALLSSLAA